MPLWEEAILRGKRASHCKGQGHFVTSVVTCAKTAQPIEMLFGSWALMGPWNQVLEGVSDPTMGKANFGERVPTGKYRDTLWSPVRIWLNRS